MTTKTGKARGSLGINTSIVSPAPKTEKKISDIERARIARNLRFSRLSVVRSLIANDRVSKCIWVQVARYAEVWKTKKELHPAQVRAHFRGVMTCGSVWLCPVCAAKITECRRLQLKETIAEAQSQGYVLFMVTMTLQHNRKEGYTQLVEVLREAWRKVQAGKGWKLIKNRFGIRGHITALEFTVSIDNGGHPHLHILFFVRDVEVDASELREVISKRYADILNKLGKYTHHKHGVMVQTGDSAVGDYLAKYGNDKPNNTTWGLDAEMTKGSVKSGLVQGEHYTAFQLLDLVMLGDKKAGAMFLSYAEAMKGKNQLNGLTRVRRMLGMTDDIMQDEEIAAAGGGDSFKFVSLNGEQWRKVRSHAGQVLEVASIADYSTFKIYLKMLGVHLDD